jgi:hypothetical protein
MCAGKGMPPSSIKPDIKYDIPFIDWKYHVFEVDDKGIHTSCK